MECHEKAKLLCYEFTDNIIVDRTRHSVIINIDVQYMRVINKEMNRLNYRLVFAKSFNIHNAITLCFVLKSYAISS